MKKYIYMAIAVISCSFASCNGDDVMAEPTATGTIADGNGNEYGWVRIGNLDWTTSNAMNGLSMLEFKYWNNFNWITPFGDEESIEYVTNEYMPRHGNMMNYEEALKCAPDGWRLPTDEDWKNLERALGCSDVDAYGMRGDIGLSLQSTESGPRLGLGLGGIMVKVRSYGWFDMNLDYVKQYGYYWSSTPGPETSGVPTAYCRKVIYNNNYVQRAATSQENMLNVRWCRDAK